MIIWLADPDVTIHLGDVRDVLPTLPAESVDCVITSPPYWGLRDYGTGAWDGGDADCDHKRQEARAPRERRSSTLGGGTDTIRVQEEANVYRDACGKCGARRVDRQIGLEPTPDAYVANMVAVFREVRRVLAPHGTLWLNLGSSYMSSPEKGGSGPGGKNEARWSYGRASRGNGPSPSRQPPRASAYGTDDTGRAGSQDPDSACRDLCDECLTDFLSHRGRIPDTHRPHELASPQPSQTDRGSEPTGSDSASPAVSLLDAQESTTLRSWLQRRDPCSRCANRASALSVVRSSSPDAPASAHMPWLNYTRKLKPKDMVPTPWMVAMALQEDGWYLRADIVWSKPNPMPESVTDRPTKSHEYVFLLSRGPRYYFDQEAVREPNSSPEQAEHNARYAKTYDAHTERVASGQGIQPGNVNNLGIHARGGATVGRNVRSVWEIATQPFAEAHFATFPSELVRRCLLAGCPERVCRVCGKPSERIVERERIYDHTTTAVTALGDRNDLNGGETGHDVRHGPRVETQTLGWSDCGHDAYRPGVVLDPFLGSGTTALVARNHGRHTVGVELSEEYARISARRLQQLSLLAEGAV